MADDSAGKYNGGYGTGGKTTGKTTTKSKSTPGSNTTTKTGAGYKSPTTNGGTNSGSKSNIAGGTMSGVKNSAVGYTKNAGNTMSGVRSGTTTKIGGNTPATGLSRLPSGGNSPLMQKAQDRHYSNQLAQQHNLYRSPSPMDGAEDLTNNAALVNQYKGYRSPTAQPGSGAYLANRSMQMAGQPIAQAPAGAQPVSNIPIPRQNPLSDPNRFRYDKGRDRDYVFDGTDQSAVSRLVKMQETYDSPFRITSGHRSPALNKKVGGAERSQHIQGKAFDVHTDDPSREAYARLANAAGQAGFTGLGGYRPGSLHVDTGPARAWGPQKAQVLAAAGAPPPKPTAMRTIAPVVKGAVTGLKNLFADNSVPIPRPKPPIPSTVAPPSGIPMPQMKPRIPSTVAPSNGPPVPQMKPQMASIQPAMAPPAPQQAMADTGPSLWQQYAPQGLQEAVAQVPQQFTEANKLINKVGGPKMAVALAGMFGGMGGGGYQPPGPGGDFKSGTGLAGLPPAGGKAKPVVVQQGPQFSWVQWAPGQPPVQVPNQVLMQGMA